MKRVNIENQLLKEEFKYIVEGKELYVTLTVDNEDLFYNADGMLDCPLETVLRKNNFNLIELVSSVLTSIKLVKTIHEKEVLVNYIECEQVLDWIRV